MQSFMIKLVLSLTQLDRIDNGQTFPLKLPSQPKTLYRAKRTYFSDTCTCTYTWVYILISQHTICWSNELEGVKFYWLLKCKEDNQLFITVTFKVLVIRAVESMLKWMGITLIETFTPTAVYQSKQAHLYNV